MQSNSDSRPDNGDSSRIELANSISTSVDSIASFLAVSQKSDGNFPTKTYYGEAYAVSLWNSYGEKYANEVHQSLDAISNWESLDGTLQKNERFIWEFVVHALTDPLIGPVDDPDLIERWKECPHMVTNYRLMRYISRLRTGRQSKRSSVIKALWTTFHPPSSGKKWPDDRSGFIKDRHQDYSIQYHAFSASLLFDIWRNASSKAILKRFIRAAEILRELQLPNGDIIFAGRGQRQTFGHASAIFVFSAAYSVTNEERYLTAAERSWSYMAEYQREDGSYPLVLNTNEPDFPTGKPDITKPGLFGWYEYNDFFDYLPFAGWMLRRSAMVLANKPESIIKSPKHILPTPQFDRVDCDNYSAVLSRPYAHRNNGLPLPRICFKNESVTPCGGGEQYTPSIYDSRAISLPLIRDKTGNFTFAVDSLVYEYSNNTYTGKSSDIAHVRTLDFTNQRLTVSDTVSASNHEAIIENFMFFGARELTPTKFELLDRHGAKWGVATTSSPAHIESEKLYCAEGSLVAIQSSVPVECTLAKFEMKIKFDLEYKGSS